MESDYADEGEGVVNPPALMSPSEEVHSPSTHRPPSPSSMPPAALQPASLMFLSTYPLTPRTSSARTELVLARALKRSSSRRSDHSGSPASTPKSTDATSALGSLSPRMLTSPRYYGDEARSGMERQMESKAIEDRRNQLMLSNSLNSLESVVENLEATLRGVAAHAQTHTQVRKGPWSKEQDWPRQAHEASADAKMLSQRYAQAERVFAFTACSECSLFRSASQCIAFTAA